MKKSIIYTALLLTLCWMPHSACAPQAKHAETQSSCKERFKVQADGGTVWIPREELEAIVVEAYVLDCERAGAEARLALAEEQIHAQQELIDSESWWKTWGMPIIGSVGAIGLIGGFLIGFSAGR